MGHATASLSLGQLAVRFGCGLRGDPDRAVDSVATLAGGPGSLGVLANPALLAELAATPGQSPRPIPNPEPRHPPCAPKNGFPS
jgi:hypothetical protein